jgi:hypothetical protein
MTRPWPIFHAAQVDGDSEQNISTLDLESPVHEQQVAAALFNVLALLSGIFQ